MALIVSRRMLYARDERTSGVTPLTRSRGCEKLRGSVQGNKTAPAAPPACGHGESEESAMIKAVDLRKGKTVLYEGQLYVVHDAQHVAKGNKRSYMQVKLKSFKQGNIIDQRFRVDETLEVPFVEAREYEYLYEDASGFVLMDTKNYDQITVTADVVGDAKDYLTPNEKISCQLLDGQIISFELPYTVTLAIRDTPPVVKGATASAQMKEAVLETGAKVKVPGFVEPGDKVRVDTRTGAYLDRAK
jgi:elongation factor P